MSCATRRSIACDSVMKTLSDRLTRGLQNHRRVAARWPSRAPGCCSGEVKCRALDERSGMSRSAPADARAVELLNCLHVQALNMDRDPHQCGRACTCKQSPPSPQGASSDHIDITPRALCATWRAPRCSACARIMGAMSSARAALDVRALKSAAANLFIPRPPVCGAEHERSRAVCRARHPAAPRGSLLSLRSPRFTRRVVARRRLPAREERRSLLASRG